MSSFVCSTGAEAYRRDNPNAVVRLQDTGHFALETHMDEIAAALHALLAEAYMSLKYQRLVRETQPFLLFPNRDKYFPR